jgi:hypothetical protein
MGGRHHSKRAGRFRRTAIIGGGVVLLEAAALRIRSGRLGGNVVVRCSQGHLFTTIWIPGGSLKSRRSAGGDTSGARSTITGRWLRGLRRWS